MADTRWSKQKSTLILLIFIMSAMMGAIGVQGRTIRSLRQQLSDQTIVSIEVGGAKIKPCYTVTTEPTK